VSNLDHKKRLAELSPDEQVALFEQLRKRRQQEQKVSASPSAPPISRQSRQSRVFPLSFAQQRLWFLDQFEPDTSLYNIPEALHIKGQLQLHALQHTLEALVARHEPLRTTFVARDGEPVQVIAEHQAVSLPCVDLRGLPEQEREAAALRLVREEGALPFNLAKGPLLRTTLLRLDEAEFLLLLSMHHIISDGWSKGVLMRELMTLYQTLLYHPEQATSCLPEQPIQYADFAVWQRQWLQGGALEEQLAYWKNQLADLPPLQLPTDYPRPTVRTIEGAATARMLADGLAERLVALSRQEKCSLFMVLLAALNVLLSRYTGQEDIAVGTAIANRNRAEIEGLIGFFVNTLVLRTHLSGNPTFRELLGRVREVCLGAYAHQDLPFERLVEELQPSRDLSGTPLVQVMLTLQNAPKSAARVPGLSISPLQAEVRTSKFDLTLFVAGDERGLLLDVEYKKELFEEATISRMLAHLEMILAAVVANPDQPISAIPLLTPAERNQLLVERNPPRPNYRQDDCLHELFEKQAEATPDAVALVYEGEQLTYGALNERANQLAHTLRGLGVGPDACVGLCVERSLDLLVGILGILKAGGAYVPVDPATPRERISFILKDSQAPILLTQKPLLAQLPPLARQPNAGGHDPKSPLAICLDEDWPLIAQASTKDTLSLSAPSNLAYIIYTSGSTGLPKGALITHHNATRLLAATDPWYHFGRQDVWTLFHSYAFDFSVWEIWGALAFGGRLVIVPRLVAQSPDAFYELLVSEQVTILNQTPSAFRQLMQVEERFSEARPLAPQSLALRSVIFGGEALNIQSLQPWWEHHPDHSPRLINMYGITETTVHVTYRPLAEADLHLSTGSSIGSPIPDLSAYVLDRHLQLVPVGVPGELYVGGAGLARGYLNRPDLTAERFIPHPFSPEPGARLYKTGDLVRYRPNGDLEYLGRIDQQVKIRGYRIELGEIEAILQQHPAVREAVVVVHEDGAQSLAQPAPGQEEDHSHKRLVAYVTRKQHQDRSAEAAPSEAWLDEQVAQWQQVFDTIYQQPSDQKDPTFNSIGWNSSYTGQAIPEEEMREWVDHTVERILATRPQRVLEIGCGTGLLLLRIAPTCTDYWGTDFSPEVLEALRTQVINQQLAQGALLHRHADDFTSPLAEQQGTFDMVILNSVAQYFPNVEYLLRVLQGAVQMVAPGGCLFVGDVRNLPLLETFHTSVQMRQAPLSLLKEQLRQRVQKRIAQENELVLDPAFFFALQQTLPQISHVEVQLKRGHHHNELTRFRYDVRLFVNGEVSPVVEPQAVDWQKERLTLPTLRGVLENQQPERLLVKNIPNARLLTDVKAAALLASETLEGTVGQLWQEVGASTHEQGIDPEDLWKLGDELSYTVTITYSEDGALDAYDLRLVRQVQAPVAESSTLSAPTNEKAAEQRRPNRLTAFLRHPLRTLHKRNPAATAAQPDGSPQQPGTTREVLAAREARAGHLADASQRPVGRSGEIPLQPWSAYATNPLQRETTTSLIPELRDYLKRRLPDYMIPAIIMVLDALPLTSNGKLDRKALPSPDGTRPELKSAFVAPRNDNERLLAEIWAEVLGIEQIGIQDNFFELGGDSLMSIRVVAKASKVGLNITTKQLFQHQTIAELAAVAGTTAILAEQGIVTGPMRAMPAHRFTFGPKMGDPGCHSLVYLLERQEPLEPALLEQVAQHLLAHHDALRLRAIPKADDWELFITDNERPVPFWQVDLSGLTEVEQVAAIRTLMRDTALHFNLAEEPLLRVAHCYLGHRKPTPVIVAGHSLVVDMQSWQFLLEDLQIAYRQLSQGGPIQLPPKTTSYKQWSDRLVEYAQSPQLLAELPFWLSESRQRVRPLPVDYPGGLNTGASLRQALALLSEEETQTLLREIARAEGVQLDALLLTAVAQSIMQWTNERLLLFTVEGHGRAPHFDDIDLSRTLGTLAMDFPLLLDLEQTASPGEALQTVAAELQQLAQRSINYSALRHMNTDAAIVEQLAALPQPAVFFNYLASSMVPEVVEYKVSGPYNGRLYTINDTTLQPVPILVTGYIAGGQLQATWHYSANQYRAETMERLAHQTMQEVRVLIKHLQQREEKHGPGNTPRF
jgi:amino acid adenylation domain-containing protein/non-ribosomal peptide synthase protein (TIGR01720 family)